MDVTVLAALEVALLAGGAFVAGKLTRWISKGGDRRAVLMASVASWFILFGMLPFFVFAMFVNSAAVEGEIGSIESLVLNLIPFSLLAAPIIGFAQGMRRRSTPAG